MTAESRLERVKKAASLQWGQLAERLGVSRSMLDQARKGIARFGPNPERALIQMEQSLGLTDWHAPAPEWNPQTKLRHFQLQSGRTWAEIGALLGLSEAQTDDVLTGRRAMTPDEIRHLDAIAATREAADRVGALTPPPRESAAPASLADALKQDVRLAVRDLLPDLRRMIAEEVSKANGQRRRKP
jgi:transcriptional regulator with XRE-family HTH domain